MVRAWVKGVALKRRVSFLLLLASLILSACGGGASNGGGSGPEEGSPGGGEMAASSATAGGEGEIVVEHALGRTTVLRNPQKVVAFDFGVVDSLDRLGVQVTGVPQANVPAYLEKYKGDPYINVGSLMEPDFEAISELEPDVIFISGRQRDYYKQFQELAPTVYMAVDPSRYMDSFKENMRLLGKIFGREEQVEAELARIDEKVEALRQRVEALDARKALVVLVSDRNITVFGPKSRFGLVYDEFGFEPVDPNIEPSTHGMNVSFEYLAEKNPDFLFVIDRNSVVGGEGLPPAQQVLDNELVRGTKAFQNGNVVYLAPDVWYLAGGGLESVARMIDQVAEALK